MKTTFMALSNSIGMQSLLQLIVIKKMWSTPSIGRRVLWRCQKTLLIEEIIFSKNNIYQVNAHLVVFQIGSINRLCNQQDLLIDCVTNSDSAPSETKLHTLVLNLINVLQMKVLFSKNAWNKVSDVFIYIYIYIYIYIVTWSKAHPPLKMKLCSLVTPFGG